MGTTSNPCDESEADRGAAAAAVSSMRHAQRRTRRARGANLAGGVEEPGEAVLEEAGRAERDAHGLDRVRHRVDHLAAAGPARSVE
jgi:hypothetical protein